MNDQATAVLETATPTPTTDVAEVLSAIQTLFPQPDQLVELRIPDGKKTKVGFFRDHKKLADAIAERSGKVGAIYYTLNTPALGLYTQKNADRLLGQKSTADCHIVHRDWLLIDCDPVRIGEDGQPLTDQKVSATDAEKSASLATAKQVLKYLTDLGWPAPITADSGNGFHLLYRLDLTSTPEVTTAIKVLLEHLAEKFNTGAVKIDTTVYNASRITKAYGSLACKGTNIDTRPHRKSCLRNTTGGKEAVTLEQLRTAVPPPIAKKKESVKIHTKKKSGFATSSGEVGITCDKVEEFLDFYDVTHEERERTNKDDGYQWTLDACPFNPEHNNGENSVFLNDDGGLGYKCFHNSCATYGWKELRNQLEGATGSKFFFYTNTPQAVAADVNSGSKLVMRSAADIKPEKLDWLWENRIPLGKLTLFAGHPDMGKGMATMYVASRVSTGKDWADCKNPSPPMRSVILSSEDAAGDTLVPRLMAAGADLTKIVIPPHVMTGNGGEKIFSLDADLPALREALESNPDVKLVIIDPISNHLGALNMNVEQELRAALMPLGKLAEQFKVAIVIVAHYNKNQTADAIQRTGGAMAMVGAVRVAWGFGMSKDEGTRMMLPIKANIAKNGGGLVYEIVSAVIPIDGEPANIGRIEWGGTTFDSIDTTIKLPQNNAPIYKIDAAKMWLSGYMKDGKPKLAKDVQTLAELVGHKETTLKNAYKVLGGKDSFKIDGAPTAPWYWQIEKKSEGGAQ